MGLAERRGAEKFRTDEYPGWKSRLDQAAGFDLPVEVAWAELAADGFADRYSEFFAQVYFEPLVSALAAVTIDDMGREALRAGLTKVVVRNSGQYASYIGFGFADGVLTIDHRSEANIDYGDERAKQLTRLLEANL
jgi:hypothetical protein